VSTESRHHRAAGTFGRPRVPRLLGCLRGLVLAGITAALLAQTFAVAAAPSSVRVDVFPHRRAPTRSARAAIVGGFPARGTFFASLAFIIDRRGSLRGQCTGTVIAPTVILTAGHCATNAGVVRPSSGYVVATGSRDLGSPHLQVSAVSRVVVFPGYNPLTGGGDAAILILTKPTTARAVRLGGKRRAWARTEAVVAGWGIRAWTNPRTPRLLRRGRTVIQSTGWCRRHDARYVPAAEICTIDSPHDATSPCHGDSGGPLLLPGARGKRPLEIGIITAGFAKCSPSRPDVYTRVSSLDWWLAEILARHVHR
jgi:secreted trypsin-like serine protease